MTLRAALLIATAMLGAFYAYVSALAWQPNVRVLYRLHFIEQNLRSWNHGRGPEYRLGDTVDFRREQPYLSRRGWATADEAGTWSVGRLAEIHLRVVGAERPGRIVMVVEPFTAPAQGLAAQSLEFGVNDQAPDLRSVSQAQTLSFDIPAAAWTGDDGLLRLRLRLARATSPKALGLSPDDRLLGVRLVSMSLR